MILIVGELRLVPFVQGLYRHGTVAPRAEKDRPEGAAPDFANEI
jgi:hypothetical protein